MFVNRGGQRVKKFMFLINNCPPLQYCGIQSDYKIHYVYPWQRLFYIKTKLPPVKLYVLCKYSGGQGN